MRSRASASVSAKPATAPTASRRRDAALPSLPASASPQQKTLTQPQAGSSTTASSNPSLTPQFHWNINANALHLLTSEELSALYALFKFYDSSFQGDAVPAIHCDRFLELLRDAELLSSSSDEPANELQVSSVEKVFAQAVLGKLRTYLDADDQPALTFQLFCGALFSCAMLKFPELSPPEVAYKKLLDKLLSLAPRGGGSLAGSSWARGLVQHAEHAAIPTWRLQDLGHTAGLNQQLPEAVENPVQGKGDYLQHHVFQDVLAALCHDKFNDERLQKKLDTLYDLPDEITVHFNSETVQYATQTFRTFDVFDKGTLPREEVYTLLSSMAKKLEITDIGEVLATILAGDTTINTDRKQQPLRGSLVLSMQSHIKQISLVQLMQALHACRRSRTASYLSTQQSRKNGAGAAATSPSTGLSESGKGDPTTPAATAGQHSSTSKKAAVGGKNHHSKEENGSVAGNRAARGSKGRVSTKHRGGAGNSNSTTAGAGSSTTGHNPAAHHAPSKRAVLPHTTPPHQATTATVSTSASSSEPATTKKKEKRTSQSHAHTSDKAALLRKLSKMSNVSSSESPSSSTLHGDDAASDTQSTVTTAREFPQDAQQQEQRQKQALVRQDSVRSVRSVSTSIKMPTLVAPQHQQQQDKAELDPASPGLPAWPLALQPEDQQDEHDEHSAPAGPPVLTLQLFDAHTTQSSRSDQLDGSVCYQAKLFFSPLPIRIVTSQGVYFQANGDRHEVWDTTTHSMEPRLPAEAAVLFMKKLVQDKERQGFVLLPDNEQRLAIDQLMENLRQASYPRYASPKNTKTTKHKKRRKKKKSGGHQYELGYLLRLPIRTSVMRESDDHDDPPCVRGSCQASHPLTPQVTGHLMTKWGLQPQETWISTLNDPHSMIPSDRQRTMKGSHSLPSLLGGMTAP